ncbi:MAG: N-acetyltransferase [Vagococcus sp.]|uniref:GNAT family N-acetyltransferase n=1 Tax=Vagococcus sp. TaxID=1933889 RepID=UPI002FCA599E
MTIRPINKNDDTYVLPLIVSAFEETEFGYQGEAELVKKIRQNITYNNELELVYEIDKKIVGYGLLSTCWVKNDKQSFTGLALAPLAVHKDYQRQGIGGKLMRELERTAIGLGYTFIVILGHPKYYSRFGYQPTSHYGVSSPFDVPEEFFMMKELQKDGLSQVMGTVYYSEAFN